MPLPMEDDLEKLKRLLKDELYSTSSVKFEITRGEDKTHEIIWTSKDNDKDHKLQLVMDLLLGKTRLIGDKKFIQG